MIEQNVQVVRCQDERLWVRLGTQAGCVACAGGQGCGAGLFAKLLQRKPVIIELARNELSIQPGQMLTLAFPEQVYIKLVMNTYGWPLLAALAGAYAGYSLSSWLEFEPVLVDAGTFVTGLLSGLVMTRFVRNWKNEDAILGSLKRTLYYPSDTPNMCNGTVKKPEQF
jgi:sigma-E factor negative regulatory protein RseC